MFTKLTRKERRLKVATDLRNSIKGNSNIRLSKSSLRLTERHVGEKSRAWAKRQLEGSPYLCASTALMLARLAFNSNKGRYKRFNNTYFATTTAGVYSILNDCFTVAQISTIESAFQGENVSSVFFGSNKNIDVKKAVKMGKTIKNNKKRLLAILDNIIENKGNLKP